MRVGPHPHARDHAAFMSLDVARTRSVSLVRVGGTSRRGRSLPCRSVVSGSLAVSTCLWTVILRPATSRRGSSSVPDDEVFLPPWTRVHFRPWTTALLSRWTTPFLPSPLSCRSTSRRLAPSRASVRERHAGRAHALPIDRERHGRNVHVVRRGLEEPRVRGGAQGIRHE